MVGLMKKELKAVGMIEVVIVGCNTTWAGAMTNAGHVTYLDETGLRSLISDDQVII